MMKLVATFVFALLSGQAAFAGEAKPTDESIRQLFKAMQSSKLIDTYMTQIEGTVHASMQQALAGRQPNPQQQKIVEDLGTKILTLVSASACGVRRPSDGLRGVPSRAVRAARAAAPPRAPRRLSAAPTSRAARGPRARPPVSRSTSC